MMPFTQRVRISTGLACNLRCAFCYYGDKLNTQSYATETIKRMLHKAHEYNIKDIDFSGGEPTLRADLGELVAYAKALGFRRICIITNGTRTHKMPYLEQLKQAGLNEILLSIHGHNDRTHDMLVNQKGAFDRLLRSMENSGELGLRFRTNTVVNTRNWRNLVDIAKKIGSFSPAAVNFICFNDWVNAASMTEQIAVQYSTVAMQLKAALSYLDPIVSKVTIRYIPFCFMAGFEKHVCNLRQNDFDNDEWVDSVKRLVTDIDSPRLDNYYGLLNKIWGDNAKNILNILTEEEKAIVLREAGARPFDNFLPHMATIAHKIENYGKRLDYVKADGCSGCAFNLICDGLEKTYADIHSTDELKPVDGTLIDDPHYFRKSYSEKWSV